MRPLLALALMVALAPAAPVPKGLKKASDPVRILGTWKPAEGHTVWYRFDADGTMTTWLTGTEGTTYTYAWTIDTNAAPKRMRWESKEIGYDCVYEFDGHTLRIAYPSTRRQLDAVVPGPGVYFSELTRDTSAK